MGGFATPAQTALSAAAPTGTLRGHVTDPTGALIPGARITVTTSKGAAVGQTTADAAGGFAIHGLPSGNYVVQAQFQGFATFVSKPIALEAGQTKNVAIKMVIESSQQQVEVSAEGSATVSTEADANASAIVLKGKDLDALSDDPDELSNELQALAGPSAGPNGGQIYIDGFTGGQLPPKSAIREIRINQNPFSAEFDRLGYGRIEILTKPGTDTLHGRIFMLGNDDAFNTGNPFTKDIPAYHSIMYNGTVSGPLSKNASYFFSIEQRATQDASIYTADTAILNNGTYTQGIVSGGLFAPQSRLEISPRIDLQLSQKNTLTMRYQFWRNHDTGQIGNIALPTQDSTAQSIENTLQLDDTQVISDRVVNETRFEYRRGTDWEVADPLGTTLAPVISATAPTISVPSDFTGGANAGQSSSGNSVHLELQEFVTMTAGKHAIKFGTWMRDDRQATSSSSGFNGDFSFPSLSAYIDTLNGLANHETVAQIAAACPSGQQCTPNKLTYVTGPYAFLGNIYDGAFFYQDDWKYNRFLTLSGGLRFETQNHTADHSDFAPRFAFAYALDGHKNQRQAKTVLRGGFGFFYDRFGISNLMDLEQDNGTAKSQTTTVITNPTCFDPNSLANALKQGCTPAGVSTTSAAPQIDTIAPNYRSPYSEQAGASLERQLTRTSTLTLTYLHSFGVHQLVVRDANPYEYEPGTNFFYNSTTGPRILAKDGINSIVDQFFPEAVYKQNQLILNINGQITRNFSMAGFYNWTNADSDGGAGSHPSNSYNLNQDYGRASFVHPQFLFLMGTYNAPWALTFNPFMVVQAGKPYNLTSAQDLTGDNFFNDRPGLATTAPDPADVNPADVAQTSFGDLDTDPQPGEQLIAPGVGREPTALAFNLRLSRSFGIGPATESSGGPPMMHGGPPGGSSGGSHGHSSGMSGFGGGIFGSGGSSSHFHGGMSNTGRKYSLTFSIQALNLFNDVNYGTPSGTVIPTPEGNGVNGPGARFGVSTHLASGMFASPTSSASRRVFLQAFFSF